MKPDRRLAKGRPIGRGQKLIGHPPSQATIDRRLAVAAFDLMCRARPLKPAPFRFEGSTVSAAALALRADQRRGLV